MTSLAYINIVYIYFDRVMEMTGSPTPTEQLSNNTMAPNGQFNAPDDYFLEETSMTNFFFFIPYLLY